MNIVLAEAQLKSMHREACTEARRARLARAVRAERRAERAVRAARLAESRAAADRFTVGSLATR